MTEHRTIPIDWTEINPEIGELLEKDQRFLSAARRFFDSFEDGIDVTEAAFESARASLKDRDNLEEISDEIVAGELEAAYLYLNNDPDYLDRINSEIADAIS